MVGIRKAEAVRGQLSVVSCTVGLQAEPTVVERAVLVLLAT